MTSYVQQGREFERDADYITDRITADGRGDWPVEPGRYRLVVARACPWANRAIIVRRLLGLEPVLSMGVCGPTHDERSWTFDLDPGGRDPVLGYERLQEAYLARVPGLRPGHHRAGDRRHPQPAGRHQRLRPAHARPVDASGARYHRDGAPDLYPERPPRRDRRGQRASSTPTSTTVSTAAASPARRSPTSAPTTGCSPASTGCRSGSRTSATSSATRSPRPTSGCSRRWPASTPSTTATSSATARSWPSCRCCGPTPETCSRRPGFGDTIDFVHIKRHYYVVHRGHQPDRHRARRARRSPAG